MLTKEEMLACPVATTVQMIGSKRKLLIGLMSIFWTQKVKLFMLHF